MWPLVMHWKNPMERDWRETFISLLQLIKHKFNGAHNSRNTVQELYPELKKAKAVAF